eukprot:CAMPEP_0118878508 /NCGR_PEP_ID=MMETSP1163-20130328/18421_1 /TAXON_ID=124430 /ORGANISM="Phaeomonas parva, Strain CCMP2877" /LENGTH=41 /DNA_ID= /DNA_START= /DNA_END= /DNA_ORIENTATION=
MARRLSPARAKWQEGSHRRAPGALKAEGLWRAARAPRKGDG